MRSSFAILATVYAAAVGTASALVEAGDRTWVDAYAIGHDERTSGSGCSPDGCVADNTRDGSLSANSRWSCQGDSLDRSDDGTGCFISYIFEEPQDLVRMRIAFHKGDENTRTLNVYDNDDYHSTITSSGSSLGYQVFDLNTDETKELRLHINEPRRDSHVWLSITEVMFDVK